MVRSHRVTAALLPRVALASGCLLLTLACQSKPDGETVAAAAPPSRTQASGSGTETGTPILDGPFLLRMDWQQAKEISVKHLEVAPFFRVAASEIEVLKTAPDGSVRKARARGRVYVEMNFTDTGRVLCQEALVSGDELILRGRPILQRGGSLIEGLDEGTVFYMLGPSLRVIGRHRITNQKSVLAEMEAEAAVAPVRAGGSESQVFPALPNTAPPLPTALGAWLGGPNPLLPPLTPNAVPEDVRLRMRAEAESIEVEPLPDPPMVPNAATPQKSVIPAAPPDEKPPLLPVPEPKPDAKK